MARFDCPECGRRKPLVLRTEGGVENLACPDCGTVPDAQEVFVRVGHVDGTYEDVPVTSETGRERLTDRMADALGL